MDKNNNFRKSKIILDKYLNSNRSAIYISSVLLLTFLVIGFSYNTSLVKTFDSSILISFRSAVNSLNPAYSKAITSFIIVITNLGNSIILTLAVLSFSYYIHIKLSKPYFYGYIFSIVSATILLFLIKTIFARVRPDVVPHLVFANYYSFPSGHATMSPVIYFLALLILTKDLNNIYLKNIIRIIVLLIIGLIGLSRVYLGVHFPTDVLAGWALGFSWTLISFLVIKNKTDIKNGA